MLAARSADVAATAHTAAPATAPAVRGRPGQVAPAGPAKGARPGMTPLIDPGSTAARWPGPFYSPPATTSGKVFFTDHNGGGWSCSASTVNSNGKNVVFTAGHCVYGTMGGEIPGETWHTNWTFYPDYYYGPDPRYGAWSAYQLWTKTNYVNYGDEPDDMGAAVMNTDGSGNHIVNVVGGQGIEWNYPQGTYQFQFGYPVGPPFNGQSLQYCTGNSSGDGAGVDSIACNMTPGASGGPWLDRFDGTFGYEDSVNSLYFHYSNGVVYKWDGPYFGDNAGSLYNAVANL